MIEAISRKRTHAPSTPAADNEDVDARSGRKAYPEPSGPSRAEAPLSQGERPHADEARDASGPTFDIDAFTRDHRDALAQECRLFELDPADARWLVDDVLREVDARVRAGEFSPEEAPDVALAVIRNRVLAQPMPAASQREVTYGEVDAATETTGLAEEDAPARYRDLEPPPTPDRAYDRAEDRSFNHEDVAPYPPAFANRGVERAIEPDAQNLHVSQVDRRGMFTGVALSSAGRHPTARQWLDDDREPASRTTRMADLYDPLDDLPAARGLLVKLGIATTVAVLAAVASLLAFDPLGWSARPEMAWFTSLRDTINPRAIISADRQAAGDDVAAADVAAAEDAADSATDDDAAGDLPMLEALGSPERVPERTAAPATGATIAPGETAQRLAVAISYPGTDASSAIAAADLSGRLAAWGVEVTGVRGVAGPAPPPGISIRYADAQARPSVEDIARTIQQILDRAQESTPVRIDPAAADARSQTGGTRVIDILVNATP